MRLQLKSSAAIFALLTLLLSSSTSAQNLPTLTEQGDVALPTAAATSDQAAASSGGAATSEDSPASATGSADASDSGSLPTELPAISSGAASTTAAASSSEDAPPRLSTDTDSGGLPSGLPKLPGGFSYPPPSVPPTANAPYMQESNVPEGTIFIAVGAALGFFGFVVLVWRALVAWSINRSVKRAAMRHSYGAYGLGVGDSKALLKPKSPYSDGHASTATLEKLGASNHQRTTTSGSRGGGPHSNLFFSPTAGAGMHTQHRNSGYLPAGYYSSGTTAVPSSTHVGGTGREGRESMRPLSQGRTVSPGSPSLPPSRGQDSYGYAGNTQASNSTLNVTGQTHGRTPSTYLEDLFDDHAPAPAPPSHDNARTRRQSGGRRHKHSRQ